MSSSQAFYDDKNDDNDNSNDSGNTSLISTLTIKVNNIKPETEKYVV